MLVRCARPTRFSPRPLARALSTIPKGRKELLEKKPDDVVITFAKRTAMGRRAKGQLAQYPVDEIMHSLFKVIMHIF